jgi:hypothetical protein
MRADRRFIALALCVGGLCVGGLSGCNSADGGYLTRGIGSDLNTPSLADQTAQLDSYVLDICRQAGLAPVESANGGQCTIDGSFSTDWAIFVQAGMNDIDHRCDDYLQWLDDKRRSTAPILQQIGDTQTGVTAVMAATNVAGPAIGIVAAAFGFARSSFTNFNSRLLLEIDHSTVQTVVLTRQRAFRSGLPQVINNRPAAIYALRSYLRICMPFTIETEINNTVTLFERGVRPTTPLVTPQNIAATMIARPTDVIPPFVAPTPVSACEPGVCQGPFEIGLNKKRTIELQSNAKISPADGKFTSVTKAAILLFLHSNKMKDPCAPNDISATDDICLKVLHRKGAVGEDCMKTTCSPATGQ